MNPSDLSKLTKVIERAAKSITDSEEFLTYQLAARLTKAAETFPEDHTILQMARFLNERSQKNLLITRGELRDTYHKLYYRGTKCGQLLKDELGEKELKSAHYSDRDAREGNVMDEALARTADPFLVNALSDAFEGKEMVDHIYTPQMAKSAEASCQFELGKLGAAPDKLKVVAGQKDLLICQATYQTPKGQSHVLVPVEVANGKALLPTIFLSRFGFKDLSLDALKEHVLDSAGKNFVVDAHKLLSTLSTAKNGLPETTSEVEEILLKVVASQGGNAQLDPNGIINQKVDEEIASIEVPESEDSFKFAEKLQTSQGTAELLFGKSLVEMGRKMIVQKLAALGYKGAQISVVNATEESIVYAASLNQGPGFKIPVRASKVHVSLPDVIIAGGQIKELSAKGISEALAEEDYQTAALTSPLYGLKAADLIENVRESLANGNLTAAEDALNVLAEKDLNGFNYAFALYTNVLNGGTMEKKASAKSECSLQVKTSSSQHLFCGHCNLPLHKVYQDENGECHPLYRKNLEHTDQAVSFITSKVYFE